MSSKFYADHIVEASKKIKNRTDTITKKDGTMTKVRRHHLSLEDQKKFIEMSEEEGRLVSPYRRGGGYWGIVETLSQLGANQEHSFGAFWDKFIEVMSDKDLPQKNGQTPWQVFSERPRRAVNGKSVIEKTHQNIRVLQRLGGTNPYGMKLAQLAACIDVLGTVKDSRIRLRINIPHGSDIVPLKETSRACPMTCTIKSGFSVRAGSPNNIVASTTSDILKGTEAAIGSNTLSIQERSVSDSLST